jgi:hypothetical protein
MNCKQARRLIQENLENSLTAPELSSLRDHLAACPACCREEEELRATLNFIRRALPPALPGSLRQGVLQRIKSEKPAGRIRGFANARRPAVAAAAVLVLLLAGNLLLPVLPVSAPLAEAPAPREQMRTMLQDNEALAVPPRPAAPEESGTLENARLTGKQQVDLRHSSAAQADEAKAANDSRQGRPDFAWRLLLNLLLVPLFIILTWRAVKKGKVV